MHCSTVAMLQLKGGEKSLTKVELRPGESQGSLLRRFRKKVARSRILSTVKKKRYFVSESEKRRIARRKAVRRERERRQKEEERYGY
jgi:small subunit ribosomal protein S21